MKKITRSTIKSFVVRELKNDNLYVSVKSSFDGMTDCVQRVEDNFAKAQSANYGTPDNTLGVQGIWLVGSSRDYFQPYSDDSYVGYKVFNACGSFLVAMKRLY